MNRDALNAQTYLDVTDDQERRFSEAFSLIHEAIGRKVFPGAALAVTLQKTLVAWRGFGRFTYEAESSAVTRETVWDLASLTKVLATTSMAMVLYERGELQLDTRVVEVLPEFADGADRLREAVTVRMLLTHSSGLPAHRKLYLDTNGRAAMVSAALRVPLERAPMTGTEYSDIGFMVLGELLEQIAGERLNLFCEREIFSKLKIWMTFSPQPDVLSRVAPTVDDVANRGGVVQAEVNDENANAMGGIAGHAGLFADALSVSRFARCMLRGGAPLFGAETVQLFTTRDETPEGTSRALGWDTPSAPSQSGTKFSARSFGHLGFTGTSLWCDPERGLSVTLLTNRTWPNGQNQAIKEVRPLVHDAIVRGVENR